MQSKEQSKARQHNVMQSLGSAPMGLGKEPTNASKKMAHRAGYAEKLWRPCLHVVGCIAHGHLEYYGIMPPDVAKDANMDTFPLRFWWPSSSPEGFVTSPRMEAKLHPCGKENLNNAAIGLMDLDPMDLDPIKSNSFPVLPK
jgi:hypothetical protein